MKKIAIFDEVRVQSELRKYLSSAITVPTTVTTAGDPWTDVAGATVTVVPEGLNEKWEIVFQGTADLNSPTGEVYGNLRIVDSSDNLIDSAISLSSASIPGGFYPTAMPIRLVARDTISATKTYKLQARKGTNGNSFQIWVGNYTGALTDPDISQKFYAVKVPTDSVYVAGGAISTTTETVDNAANWKDVLGATVTVTPGAANEKVEINFRGSLSMLTVGGAQCYANLRIVDSSDNLIDNAILLAVDRKLTASNFTVPVHLVARDTISAAKTYKLQIRKAVATSAGIYQDTFTGDLVDPDIKQLFYAQRFPTAPVYVESSTITTSTATVSDTPVDVSGASITINPTTPGEQWELRFQGLVDVLGDSSNVVLGTIHIADSANNIIDTSTRFIAATPETNGFNCGMPIDLVARVKVYVPTTYKLRIRKSVDGTHVRVLGGGDFTGGLTNPDLAQRFWAVKYPGTQNVSQVSSGTYVRAKKTSGANTGLAYETISGWDTVTEDDSSESFDAATGIFTAKEAGDFLITASAGNSETVGVVGLLITKNGTSDIQAASAGPPASTNIVLTVSTIVRLAVGETLRLRFYSQTASPYANTSIAIKKIL